MTENDNTKSAMTTGSRFLVKDDIIEISGSEEFVSRQIELLKDSIMSRLEKPTSVEHVTAKKSILYLEPSSSSRVNQDTIEYVAKSELDKEDPGYENVFIRNGNDISIIADVPGANVSQRMINLILIYLWAKQQIGVEEVAFKELREMCEKYGEINKPNFSKILNSNRKLFLITGESKSQNARLIRPGIKAAEKLITELNSK